MLLLIARRFPDFRFRGIADHLYAGSSVLHGVLSQVSNVSFVMRGRPDAALYELPAVAEGSTRGRPRTKGARLQTPSSGRPPHPEAFAEARIELYGKMISMRVASFEGMAYRSLPGRLVRYVIAYDPLGIYEPSYFFRNWLSKIHGLNSAPPCGDQRRWASSSIVWSSSGTCGTANMKRLGDGICGSSATHSGALKNPGLVSNARRGYCVSTSPFEPFVDRDRAIPQHGHP